MFLNYFLWLEQTYTVKFIFYVQVVTLLDTTPDQSMVDEGIAREIINRIQKLRKKVDHKPFVLRSLIAFNVFLILFSEASFFLFQYGPAIVYQLYDYKLLTQEII